MSSGYVRTQFKSFLSANSAENVIDLSAQYETIEEVVSSAGIGRNDDWLGLQFIGSNEEPISVQATNDKGRYREIGSVFIHIVERNKPNVADDIITRAETLRDLLRGRRINDIIIESMTPPNFEQGATLELDGGYQAGSFIINYERDINL